MLPEPGNISSNDRASKVIDHTIGDCTKVLWMQCEMTRAGTKYLGTFLKRSRYCLSDCIYPAEGLTSRSCDSWS